MLFIQEEIVLQPRPRGFHLITAEIENQLPQLRNVSVGTAHVFIKHTSASLCVNENADPSVRVDMEAFFNRAVSERETYFTHVFEGPDDMTSHIKAVILGSSVTVPVTSGAFNLGVWQGIYLCEHRNRGGARRVVVTVMGREV